MALAPEQSVIITTYEGVAQRAGTFDGFRTLRVVVDGETVSEIPFVGGTVQAQQASVEILARTMNQGYQTLTEDVGGILDFDAVGLQPAQINGVVSQIFGGADSLMYDETVVFSASEEGFVDLLDGLVEAGAELLALFA